MDACTSGGSERHAPREAVCNGVEFSVDVADGPGTPSGGELLPQVVAFSDEMNSVGTPASGA